MAQTLHLEYMCTKDELKEAQSLHLRKKVAGGSKWRTNVVLIVVLVGMLLSFYFRVQREVAPAYRPVAVLGFVALCIAVHLVRKRFSPCAQRQPRSST